MSSHRIRSGLIAKSTSNTLTAKLQAAEIAQLEKELAAVQGKDLEAIEQLEWALEFAKAQLHGEWS